MSAYAKPSFRNDDLDKAKGIAIILVVFGHIVARTPPNNNDWYIIAKSIVYDFHMPFFMFISGATLFIRPKHMKSLADIRMFSLNKFNRLFPPYIIFAALVCLGKYISAYFFHIDNKINGIEDAFNVVLYPMQSPASFLWYIHTLFFFSIFSVAAMFLSKKNLVPMLLFSAALQLAPYINFLAIGQMTKFFFFFCLGMLASEHWEKLVGHIRSMKIPYLSIFILFCTARVLMPDAIPWQAIALLSIPALISLCAFQSPYIPQLLLYFGKHVFAIYLMNTILIGLCKGIFLKFIPWDGLYFVLLYVPLLMFSGLWLPIFVKEKLLIHFPALHRIVT